MLRLFFFLVTVSYSRVVLFFVEGVVLDGGFVGFFYVGILFGCCSYGSL